MQSPHAGSLLRSSAFPLVLALLWLAPPCAAAADEPVPLTLLLSGGDSVQVVHVRPAGLDMFRYVGVDSAEGYVGAHRLRAVRDAEGRDRTREVLRGRRTIGQEPAFSRPGPGGSPFRAARSKPLRDEETFSLFELGFYARLDGSEPSRAHDEILVGLDIGALRNLSRSFAVGGSLHFQTDDARDGLGLALRVRRWLDNTMSVDGSAGAIIGGDDSRGMFRPPAYYGEVAFNLGDYFQVAGRVDSWAYRSHVYDFHPSSPGGGGKSNRETLVHLGGRVGPYPTVLAAFGLLVVAGVVAATR